jgi:hypothetical protein
MHQDALLESAPVLQRRPHRDTGGGKTLATCRAVGIAGGSAAEAARRARRQAASFYTAFIPVIIVIPTLVPTVRA